MKTNVTSTSRMAYSQLKKRLGQKQTEVYQTIARIQPCDNLSISLTLNLPINSITGRVYELRDMGLVEEAGKHHNELTGRLTTHWRLTPKQQQLWSDM